MEKKFKIGDLVVLKSDGPTMTVDGFKMSINLHGPATYSGKVSCVWFDEGKKQTELFHQDSLELED